MKFNPRNGYVLLEKLEEDKKKEGREVLLPEGVSLHDPNKDSFFKPYRAQSFEGMLGGIFIVDDRMVEKFIFGGDQFLVVKEQYVVGEFHE